jgi:hypothetical protein
VTFIAWLAATGLFALAALGTLTPSTSLALLGVWVATVNTPFTIPAVIRIPGDTTSLAIVIAVVIRDSGLTAGYADVRTSEVVPNVHAPML